MVGIPSLPVNRSQIAVSAQGTSNVPTAVLSGFGACSAGSRYPKLEALQHPDVGSSTSFPECKMLAVWCRDRPTDRHLCIFEHRPGPPLQLDVQQCPCSGVGIRPRPQAAAVCGKIDAAD